MMNLSDSMNGNNYCKVNTLMNCLCDFLSALSVCVHDQMRVN